MPPLRVMTAPACVLYGLLSLEKRTSRWMRKIDFLLSALSGIFFLANALTRLKQVARGEDEGKAYTAGENVERFLRERLNGVEYRGGRPHKRVPEAVYVEPSTRL